MAKARQSRAKTPDAAVRGGGKQAGDATHVGKRPAVTLKAN